jgi:hypothetical protein
MTISPPLGRFVAGTGAADRRMRPAQHARPAVALSPIVEAFPWDKGRKPARQLYCATLADCGFGAGDNAGWAKDVPGFGADFKSAVHKRYTALVALHPYGEVLPYADNRITVGNAGLNDYGVPIARIEFKYRENERRMMTEMYQNAAAILKEAKAEILPYDPTFMGIPGQAIHEHSTCRTRAPYHVLLGAAGEQQENGLAASAGGPGEELSHERALSQKVSSWDNKQRPAFGCRDAEKSQMSSCSPAATRRSRGRELKTSESNRSRTGE